MNDPKQLEIFRAVIGHYIIHYHCNHVSNLSRLMGKPTICIGENKDADQLRGNREADSSST